MITLTTGYRVPLGTYLWGSLKINVLIKAMTILKEVSSLEGYPVRGLGEGFTSQLSLPPSLPPSPPACSVHDRKMSVLGFCSVIQCPVRPATVLSLANQFVPSMVAQLTTLIDLYKRKSVIKNRVQVSFGKGSFVS